MKHTRPITQISRGYGPAVHRYYDIMIEGPEGSRLLYFEFDGPIPGPGRIIVADADGSNPREIAKTDEAIGHMGGSASWLGPATLAYSPTFMSGSGAFIIDIDTGETIGEIAADVRSFSTANGLAVLLGEGAYNDPERFRKRQRLQTFDPATGEQKLLVTAEQCHAIHPLRDRFDPDHTNFQNPKWSPDGTQLFTVFGTEVYRRCSRDHEYSRIKSLMLMDADGGNLQYISEFGHHPMWTPDGQAIVCYEINGKSQDVVLHHLEDGRKKVLLADFPGVHCSFNRAQTHLVTDVFHHNDERADILLIDLCSGEREVLASGRHGPFDHVTGSHPHPQWSRDESKIFFNMADTGQPQLYAVDVSHI